MRFHPFLFLVLIGMLVVGSACQPVMPEEEMPGMANPASVFCEEQGGTLEIRAGDDGGETGYCMFDDGSECEEWAFFRGECSPGGE